MSENQTAAPRRRGCGFGCLLMVAIVFGMVMLMLLAGIIALTQGGGQGEPGGALRGLFARTMGADDVGEDEAPFMVEMWSSGKGDVKVVRIPVEGLIMLGEGSMWRSGNANTVLRSIRRATHDEEVKGLILEINSGGGGITDSDIIYRALLRFKEANPDRIIVSIFGDTAASGAYYIALASDHILAHPTTLTGSIGVILQSYNVKELAQKLGIQDVTIKSGENKDLLNPFKEMPPEQREMLQSVISAMHSRFVSLVAQHRKLPKEVVEPLADGRVFAAEEAWKHKLIDGLGYAEDAQAKIAELLDAKGGVKVYRYGEHVTLMDLLSRPGFGLQLDLKRLLQNDADSPRLMYRWSF
ncbi:MAG: signal peptide peptidase SppA [Kiritimatiellaeota bacterium]|nr:signal peptide peptidase SppA [Kiritimatiellota bacterium]